MTTCNNNSVTNAQIRRYLGHELPDSLGVRSCRVKIKRDGTIHRYGSPDPFDRTCDHWHYLGHRDDCAKEIAAEAMHKILGD
tara:strand:+ start:360 stop:605 length:246 start_codon:yes stop_codon:yes gene_type:complete